MVHRSHTAEFSLAFCIEYIHPPVGQTKFYFVVMSELCSVFRLEITVPVG